MRVLIPAAGLGQRFQEVGFTFPKPLIDVNGKPMIQRVVENMLPLMPKEFVFLVRREHLDQYALADMFSQIVPSDIKVKLVPVDGTTEGAACTALLAKQFILSDDDSLLIANSDQLVEYSSINFNLIRRNEDFSGIVFCFNAVHPKWSFVRCDEFGNVIEVAEKVPISNIATCGIYYYRRGFDFVRNAEAMIIQNRRVKGEFYIAPVYNEFIEAGKTIVPFMVERMYGLGTPEDLERYLNAYSR